MSHVRHIACAALAVGLLVHGHAQAQAKNGEKKIYCWNEAGRKVCGDALPASAADSARTEISARSGITTGRVDRALSETERSAAALAADAARKQAEAEAIQQRRDLAMVESYMTEGDLRRAYGERTALLDETLKASRLGLANLRLSLLSLLRQANDLELQGKPVAKALAVNIQSQHTDLLRQQAIMRDQQEERASLGADLEHAVERYRALKRPQAT